MGTKTTAEPDEPMFILLALAHDFYCTHDPCSCKSPDDIEASDPNGPSAWWPAAKLGVSAEFVAGVLSTFPKHSADHPADCLSEAKAVMRAIAEEMFQDDLREKP